eukprot:2259773-Rhodomonas_salina.3
MSGYGVFHEMRDAFHVFHEICGTFHELWMCMRIGVSPTDPRVSCYQEQYVSVGVFGVPRRGAGGGGDLEEAKQGLEMAMLQRGGRKVRYFLCEMLR